MGFLTELKSAISILENPAGVDESIVKSARIDVARAYEMIKKCDPDIVDDNDTKINVDMIMPIHAGQLVVGRVNDSIAITINPGSYSEDQDILWGLIRDCVANVGTYKMYMAFSEEPLEDVD